jgi:hypothetical protein
LAWLEGDLAHRILVSTLKFDGCHLCSHVHHFARLVTACSGKPEIIVRENEVHNRIIVDFEVHIDLVRGSRGCVEEADISLLIAHGCDRRSMGAGLAEHDSTACAIIIVAVMEI